MCDVAENWYQKAIERSCKGLRTRFKRLLIRAEEQRNKEEVKKRKESNRKERKDYA